MFCIIQAIVDRTGQSSSWQDTRLHRPTIDGVSHILLAVKDIADGPEYLNYPEYICM